MITVRDMELLLEIKDGFDEIEECLGKTMGGLHFNPGSPLSKVNRIYTVIRNLSPLYDPERDRGLDYETLEVSRILESELPNEEKARKLLMMD